MKLLFTLFLLASSQVAMASEAPELYCVSTKSFKDANTWLINQVNLFTNKKGTVHVRVQYVACSQEECGNFDTNNVQTIVGLNYDENTRTLTNGTGNFSLKVDNRALTPAAAESILNRNNVAQNSLENAKGFKIQFKQYFRAKLLSYNHPGLSTNWANAVNNAFKAGVTDYVCGYKGDATGPTPTIFSGDNSND